MTVWPQIVWLALVLFGVGVSAARLGEPRRGTYSLVYDVLLAPAIGFFIMYCGGWFAPLGWAP